MNADIVIVGAGIAGLRCGIELLHKRPKSTIVILEKYNYKGGRVVTYKKTLEDVKGNCTHLQWENGAGRIHSSHTKVLDLVKQYDLTPIPLSTDQFYTTTGELEPSSFENLMQLFGPSLREFEPSILATHTLRELFQMLLQERTNAFLNQFPYRGEVDTLRADLGLQSFEDEMGTYQGYVVLKEGLSALINGMVKEFERLGGQIFANQTVTEIQKEKEVYLVRSKTKAGDVVWESKQVLCALHSDALKQIPCFSNWSTLKHLKMEPLLRVYAVFPTQKGKSWFSEIGRTVSPGPIRYFIPINPSCGIVMLSYTDGKDARHLLSILNKGEDELEEYLMKEIRKMFPQHTIPEPLFFKAHPWFEGCTYWLPGSYDPAKLSEESLQPFPETMPELYCCGESFSLKQAWMEGALEQADALLKKFF
jgi:monoamine oxidase